MYLEIGRVAVLSLLHEVTMVDVYYLRRFASHRTALCAAKAKSIFFQQWPGLSARIYEHNSKIVVDNLDVCRSIHCIVACMCAGMNYYLLDWSNPQFVFIQRIFGKANNAYLSS